MSAALDPGLLARLAAVDTPSVCNAVEVAEGRRGFGRYTRRPFGAVHGGGTMVGRARTARIQSAVPDHAAPEDTRSRRRAYYRHMASGDGPRLAVVEDMSGAAMAGAWWGEVHGHAHLALGLSGAITNGLVRDTDAIPPEFGVLGGGYGPSHAFVHVVDLGHPVAIHGLVVRDGDLVHADRHGACVIPEAVLPDLADALDRMTASEAAIIDPCREPLSIEAFEEAWAAFELART